MSTVHPQGIPGNTPRRNEASSTIACPAADVTRTAATQHGWGVNRGNHASALS